MANRHSPAAPEDSSDKLLKAMEKKKFHSFDRSENYKLRLQQLQNGIKSESAPLSHSRQPINLWGISLFNRKWQGAYFLTAMLGVIRYSGTLLIGDALHKHNLLGILYAVYCLEDQKGREEALKKFLTISCRMEEASSDLENQVKKLETWRNGAMEAIRSETEELSQQSDEPYSFIFNAIPEGLAQWLENQAIQLGDRWLQENSTAILLAIWFIDKESRPNDSVEKKSLSAEQWVNFSAKDKIDYVNKGYGDGKLPFNIVRWADWADYKEDTYEKKKNKYLTRMRSQSDLWKAASRDYEQSSRHIRGQLKDILSSNQAELDKRTKDKSIKFIFSEYMITEGLKLTVLPVMKGYQRVLYPGKASGLVVALHKLFSDSPVSDSPVSDSPVFDSPVSICSEWFELIFERSKKKLHQPKDLFRTVLGIGTEYTKDYLEDYWSDTVFELIVKEYLSRDYLNDNIIKTNNRIIIETIAQKTIMYTVWDWNPTLTEEEKKVLAKFLPSSSRSNKTETEILKVRIKDFREGCYELSEREIVSEDEIKIIVAMGIEILKESVIEAHLNSIVKQKSGESEAWEFFKEIVQSIVELVVSSEFLMERFVSGMKSLSSFSTVINQLENVRMDELIHLGNDKSVLEQRLIFKYQITELFFYTYLKQISKKDISNNWMGELKDVAQTMGWIVLMIFGKELDYVSDGEDLINIKGTIEGVAVRAEILSDQFFKDKDKDKGKVKVKDFIYTAFLRSDPMKEWKASFLNVAERHSLNTREDDAQSQNETQLKKGDESPTLTQTRGVIEQLEKREISFQEFPKAIARLSNERCIHVSRKLLLDRSRTPTPTSVASQNMWAGNKDGDKKEPDQRSCTSQNQPTP